MLKLSTPAAHEQISVRIPSAPRGGSSRNILQNPECMHRVLVPAQSDVALEIYLQNSIFEYCRLTLAKCGMQPCQGASRNCNSAGQSGRFTCSPSMSLFRQTSTRRANGEPVAAQSFSQPVRSATSNGAHWAFKTCIAALKVIASGCNIHDLHAHVSSESL